MYSEINIEGLETEAEKIVLDNDRMLYLPFFSAAEKFCSENNVLFGGRVGIDLLIGESITKDSFLWELYCDDTFNTAKLLANALSNVNSPHIPTKTVALQTNIRHKEFTIFINSRMLFKIYSLDKYRGINLSQLMGPATRDSYFTKIPIKCISEEMQLIEIYRTLYNPAKMSLWTKYIAAEDIIYNTIKDFVAEKAVKEISGGDCKINKHHLESDIIKKIITGSNNILIGDHALASLGIENNPSRIQIITEEPIEKISNAVESLIKASAPSAKVTFIRYSLNIPSDFQIVKYTLYINTGKEQMPIADIFNSAEFELIPWWEGSGKYQKIKIGNPWVLLRFQFIDIWILRLILNLGTDNPEFIKTKIRSIVNRASEIRKIVKDYLSTDPAKIFQLDNYVGNYIDENIAKKKLIKELGERFQTYYPAKNLNS